MTTQTDTNKANRQRIIAKVQALLSKTVDRGCSEAEALAAAGKADELMQEYDLSYTDIETELRDESYGARKRPFGGGSTRRRTFHEVLNCVATIGNYWDCKCWSSGAELVFFGSKDDTEQAHHMTDMIRLAMDNEWTRYLNGPNRDTRKHGRTLRASFMVGMAMRIAERLREMKAARSNAAHATGTSLVVLKTAIVTEKYAQHIRDNKMRMSTSSRKPTVGDSGAYYAGKDAGSRVGLGQAAQTADTLSSVCMTLMRRKGVAP